MTIDGRAHMTNDQAADALGALLRDLTTMRDYLDDRGKHTYELAQRFIENARRDPSSREYDERQATMLEYQHYIWHEIAGRVNQLLVAYGAPVGDDDEHNTSTGTREDEDA